LNFTGTQCILQSGIPYGIQPSDGGVTFAGDNVANSLSLGVTVYADFGNPNDLTNRNIVEINKSLQSFGLLFLWFVSFVFFAGMLIILIPK